MIPLILMSPVYSLDSVEIFSSSIFSYIYAIFWDSWSRGQDCRYAFHVIFFLRRSKGTKLISLGWDRYYVEHNAMILSGVTCDLEP
jgi:hypothetical protein